MRRRGCYQGVLSHEVGEVARSGAEGRRGFSRATATCRGTSRERRFAGHATTGFIRETPSASLRSAPSPEGKETKGHCAEVGRGKKSYEL